MTRGQAILRLIEIEGTSMARGNGRWLKSEPPAILRALHVLELPQHEHAAILEHFELPQEAPQ